MDGRLSFVEHLRTTSAKAIQCGANLARLMPNIGGPREAKRRLVASVVHSKLIYAAPVWAKALQHHAIQRRLFSAQRLVALTIVSAYRTVSTSAALVLACVPPIHLLAEERQEPFQLRKELTRIPYKWNSRSYFFVSDKVCQRLIQSDNSIENYAAHDLRQTDRQTLS